MAITKYNGAINTIQSLSDRPNQNEGLTAAQLKLKFDKSAIDMKAYIDDTLTVELDDLDAENIKKTGNQTIQGVKTFESSPIVPTPTLDNEAVPKVYVDNGIIAQAEDLDRHESSSDHDGRYYTKTQLINGQLDTRYYTETELSATTGATKIGATVIPTLNGDTVQEVLESVKNKFDDIAEINVNVEVANTHTAANGEVYDTLPDRLDNVDEQLADIVTLKPNGTDDTQNIINAYNALPLTGGKIKLFKGLFKITSTLDFSTKKVWLEGEGYSTLYGSENYAPTVILKTGNFDGIVLGYTGSQISNLQIDGDIGNGGDGLVIKQSRITVKNITITSQGNDGIRIGGATSFNCNVWRLNNVFCFKNGRYGIYIHDGSSSISPNANAGLLMGADCRENMSDGICVENSIDCSFYSLCNQVNVGIGLHFKANAKGHQVYGCYTEANTGGEIILDSGADRNIVIGYRSGVSGDAITDNGTANFILGRDSNITNNLPFLKSPFAVKEYNLDNNAVSGYWNVTQDAGRNAVYQLLGTSANAYVIFKHGSTGNVTLNPYQLLIGGTGGTIVKRHISNFGTIDFPNIPINSIVEMTLTVTGAAVGDTVVATPNGAVESGLVWSAYVSALNTVTIRLANVTSSDINPGAIAWRADVWQH